MSDRFKLFYLCLSIILCFVFAGSVAAREPTAFERRLDSGEVFVNFVPVKGFDEPMAVVRAVINAPAEPVWKIVSNCGKYKDTMNRIKASKMQVMPDGTIRCTVTVDMPFPYSDLTATTQCVHKEDKENGKYLRTWKLLYSTDYKVNQGSWTLEPFLGDKNRTLVVYKALAIPQAWVPQTIRDWAQKKKLPEMIDKIRQKSVK